MNAGKKALSKKEQEDLRRKVSFKKHKDHLYVNVSKQFT